MSKAGLGKLISIFVVSLVVLGAFFVLVGASNRASAQATSAARTPTTGTVDSSPVTASPLTSIPTEARDTSWTLKMDSSIRESALRASKNLVSVIIYADDMNALAPILDRYGVVSMPEEFRGQTMRDATRVNAVSGGITSTRVMVPEFVLATIAKLPGVLGMERPSDIATADYTNFDLTEARARINALRAANALPNTGTAPLDWGVVKSQHATDAWSLGYMGDGVNIAVQDYGTDFAHPNIVNSYAVDTNPASPYFGYPIMHSQFSIWNNLELFTADSDIDRAPYPIFFSVGGSSWYSDTTYQATKNATDEILYATTDAYGFDQLTPRVAPNYPSCTGSGTRINRTYFVGTIASASGWFHLGVNKDQYLEGIMCERVGILVVDSTTPFVYDTVLVDVNDNYDFTDDKIVTIGDPVSGWDIDGDGNYDVSGGLLYFIANQQGSAPAETVIASATGTETNANLAHGWVESDVQGVNLYAPTLALGSLYWPSSTEDVWEEVISSTTGSEAGTTTSLTTGYSYFSGTAVDSAALLAAGYPLYKVYEIYNSSGDLVDGTDYTINMTTGQISWLVDFTVGDFVDIIYQFQTWRVNFDSGELTFETPPTAGAAVVATYNWGLPVPYSNITAQRQGWDLFVPGPGDLVAFYGAFNLGEEHGTWVATDLAGNPFGNFFGIFDIYGTAPHAKIIGVDLMTALDDPELFYFSSHGYDGVPGTGDEANIATNSWGYINPQETGFTFFERYIYDLTTNVAPDFTILFAAGNNGPGYSTVTPPDAAPGIITVGGGTMMNYRWLYGFDEGIAYYDWPLLGTGVFGVGPFGDMADFSGHGPTLMGTPEPDIVSAAEFGFGGRPLNSACLEWFCSGIDAWDLWSGTSMSTPITAGIVGLIYQSYMEAWGSWPTSTVAKEILMSSADDHGFDVLSQGAGWANASAAVELASGANGIRVDPSFLAPGTYQGVHRPAFVNFINPGSSYVSTLTVDNPTASPTTVTIGDAMYSKIAPDYTFTWNFTKGAGVRDERVLKPSGLYAGDGVTQLNATDLSAAWASADFVRISLIRDPAVLTTSPDTFLELFDWYNYVHDVVGEFVAESTITSEVDQVLMTGVNGETKAFANAPVLPGYEFSRDSTGVMTEIPACILIDDGTYTFDSTTGLVTLCAPLLDGEQLTGTYDWYVPLNAGDTFPLSGFDITPGSETVYLNGAPWGSQGVEWTIDYVGGTLTINQDMSPGDLIEIDYSWDNPGYDGILERSRMTFMESTGGSLVVDLQHPAARIHDGLVLSVRDFNGAKGLTPATVEFYGKVDWPWATESVSSLPVAAGTSAPFTVTFSVPAGTQAGMYQGVITLTSGGKMTLVPVVITVPLAAFPLTFGGGTPATTLYDNNAVSMGTPSNAPWRQVGDSRLFWADFSVMSADNRRMVYSLILNDAPSEGEITAYALEPDALFTDDAVYGPGTMVQVATTKELLGATDTLSINNEFLSTDVLSGLTAFQVKALNSYKSDEPFRLEVGIMQTDPSTARISSNQLAGSVPISVTADVPMHGGIGVATLQALQQTFIGRHVDPYAYPGGDFVAYLFASANRVETVIEPGTIVATWSLRFYNGANDVDMGLFYDDNCDGVYTAGDVRGGTSGATSANPEQITLGFPAEGCYWVHAAGYDVAAGSLFDLTFSTSVIGVSAYSAQGAPTATVPANTASGFDLAWNFPLTKAEAVTQDFLFISPGFAPYALAQQLTVVFSYDITPPTLEAPLPAAGSVVADSRPGIFAQITDNQPGAIASRGEIDRNTVRIWLDGVDITSLASISVAPATNVGYPAGTVLYAPSQPLAEGDHTVMVQAGDFAGNLATMSWTFTIDTAAPALTITSPVPGLTTSATSVTVMGMTEPGALVVVAGQAALVDDQGRFAATVALSAGSNAIDITSTDAIGNVASTTVTVVQDAVAPAITLLRSSAGALTNKDMTVVSGVVSEAASLTVNGIEALVHADGSFSVAVPLVEGSNAIDLSATDAAGNSGTASLTVARDSTPPTLSMEALPAETSNPTITVSGSVEAGIAFVTVNGQPVPVTSGRYSTDVALSFGPNGIFVSATDAAGNSMTVSQATSYVPTGVTASSVGLVLLPVLAVVALLVGLLLGQWMQGRKGGGPPEGPEGKEGEPKEETPASLQEEELPPEGGDL